MKAASFGTGDDPCPGFRDDGINGSYVAEPLLEWEADFCVMEGV
jgi:hypothetical protein